MKAIKSDFFNTLDFDLMGNVVPDSIIPSRDFIRYAGRIFLEENKINDSSTAENMLHDFAYVLREIVKQELLHEMRERIKNIDTFYR